MRPIEARYGRLHNIGMTIVAAAMVALAVMHLAAQPPQAFTLSLTDPRLVLYVMLGAAMAFYAWLGLMRFANREPQVVIDRDGILLGFGRNRRFTWNDIEWVRLPDGARRSTVSSTKISPGP